MSGAFQNLNHEDHQGHKGLGVSVEDFGRTVVDAGLKVHKALGPGLLESVYEHCLAHELQTRGLTVTRRAALPVIYEGVRLDAGYRLDLVVENSIIVEIKAIDALARIHEAQLITYLKLSGCRLGFLLNFNVELFKQGLKRLAL